MKKTQVHVMVISLFIHLAASRVENVVVDAPAYIGKWAFMKTTVQISNRLGGGLTLVLHCKSKNNDLGIQTIAPDSSWSFYFRPNIFGTTLFFCRFMWAQQAHSFDIYDDYRDGVRKGNPCIDCTWNIDQNRPCRFNEKTNLFDLCYDWNK
ncbi:hypothetical protein BRARA_I03323 [Brassica rapa]|uniref:S-protein homolog n=2 Tax=Brassica TaxID=3705 RepID=A0A816PBA8_BRANA|nr:hypothetical protein BRARA_I03323 [Brassica rapa]CAF2046431.1 unnamed protein product [Brassica napus]CAG7865051.1 unnamed protein product [Brassica rapa]